MNNVVQIGAYEAHINIEQDQDAEDPREWDGGQLKVFPEARSFWRFAEETFGGQAQIAVSKMVDGQLHWAGPAFHTPWLGVECYSHVIDVYALCQRGNFPDRQWDVSPIVGFWTPDPSNDGDVLTEARGLMLRKEPKRAHQVLAERASGDLEVFNQWTRGDVWLFDVALIDAAGDVVDEDCCGGVYGHEFVEEEAQGVIARWMTEYGKVA